MHHWKHLQLSRRGIAMDPRTGDSYRLNEAASVILTCLQRNQTPHDIAEALTSEFSVSYASALSDVYEFIAQLNIQGA